MLPYVYSVPFPHTHPWGDGMTGWVLRKGTSRIVLSGLALMTTVGVCLATLTAARADRLLPVYRVENQKRQVALTFDAAWTADDVDAILEALARYDAPATVFAVGEWARKYPDAVRAIAAAGHELGNHSDAHKHLSALDGAAFAEDVAACNDTLATLTGKPVTLYRGPYGEYNDAAVAAVQRLGMTYVQWDCDSLDWKPEATVESIVTAACKRVRPGSILLLHIGAAHTAEALPALLERLAGEGYTFVTVSDLLLKGKTVIDHEGCQHPA